MRMIGYAHGPMVDFHREILLAAGAEYVFADPIKSRKALERTLKVMRQDDVLLICSVHALGARKATREAVAARIENCGGRVRALT